MVYLTLPFCRQIGYCSHPVFPWVCIALSVQCQRRVFLDKSCTSLWAHVISVINIDAWPAPVISSFLGICHFHLVYSASWVRGPSALGCLFVVIIQGIPRIIHLVCLVTPHPRPRSLSFKSHLWTSQSLTHATLNEFGCEISSVQFP